MIENLSPAFHVSGSTSSSAERGQFITKMLYVEDCLIRLTLICKHPSNQLLSPPIYYGHQLHHNFASFYRRHHVSLRRCDNNPATPLHLVQLEAYQVGISARSRAPISRLNFHRDVKAIAQSVGTIKLATVKLTMVELKMVQNLERWRRV